MATVFAQGGIRLDMEGEARKAFQENILKTMLAVEKTFLKVATLSANSILFNDRGGVDATVYLEDEEKMGMMSRNGWTENS